ncbi:MAG: RNA polymerase sigma factor [Chitinophagaceae bacterium]
MTAQGSLNIVQVVKEYGNLLYRFIRGKVHTDEDAEDILQDVWYQFSNTLDNEVIREVSGWLHRVARNKITDKYRHKKSELLDDLVYEGEDGVVNVGDILTSKDADAETTYLRQLFWEQLELALSELPGNQREVFVWHELEGKSFQYIAETTGDNIKTLISRKGYAVKHLRTRLLELYKEFINY